MTSHRSCVGALLLMLFLAWPLLGESPKGEAPGRGAPKISYRLSMPRPWTHLFHVEMTVGRLQPGRGHLDVAMPAWRTGRYMIFDFAGGVQEFGAADGAGGRLRWKKIDKSTWRIEPGGASSVVVRYAVYADQFDQRTRGLDDEHGFVDGTAVFMYVPESRNVPVTLAVEPYGAWHVTTGLEAVAGSRTEFTAPGYDDLADCPLEIGDQRDFTFMAEGKPHVLSLSGVCSCDADSLIADIRRIIRMNREFWGDIPYERYVFIFEALAQGRGRGGATEHINSAVFTIPQTYGRRPALCRDLVGFISHEFFHTWNVKRFRPRGMDPYDWSRENYFRELWIAEGSTSYLHGLLMARNGFGTPGGYFNAIAGMIQSDRQRPGNRAQSLTENSFDAWVSTPRARGQSYNAETDFYAKGAAVSMLLDLEIRQKSGNRHSFDDLMRALYKRFPRGSGGYTTGDVERIAGEMGGTSMRDFFEAYVDGTRPLDWEKALGYAGLTVVPLDSTPQPWLGLLPEEEGGKTVVRRVVAGSPADSAGLSPDDELIALDGYRVRAAEFLTRVADLLPGDSVRVSVFRNDRLREFTVRPSAQPVPRYAVVRTGSPSPQQKAIFESWLHTTWEETK